MRGNMRGTSSEPENSQLHSPSKSGKEGFRAIAIHAAHDALMNLTLPADLIWTVAVTPLEEQLPQPTRAPPQRIPILKCGPASARLVHPSSP
jgi:hypothetical protein